MITLDVPQPLCASESDRQWEPGDLRSAKTRFQRNSFRNRLITCYVLAGMMR